MVNCLKTIETVWLGNSRYLAGDKISVADVFGACEIEQPREHFTEEFKNKLNRFQRVPFIHDGDFKLSESIAIIRYVSKEFNIDNNWYPKDLKTQAQIDEYLEWQHNTTRALCSLYFQRKWLFPLLTGRAPDPKQLKKFEDNMVNCLNTIETVWLADSPYLAGDKISAADIFAACELEQTRIAGFDPTEGRPKMKEWLNRVRSECGPYYGEAHQILNKMAAQGGKAKL